MISRHDFLTRKLGLAALVATLVLSGCMIRIASSSHTEITMTGQTAGMTGEKGPVPVVIQEVELTLKDGEFESLDILPPAHLPVHVAPSDEKKLRASVTLIARSEEDIGSFLKRVRSEIVGRTLRVSLSPGDYSCILKTENEKIVYVLGTCISDIKIRVPATRRTEILVNGGIQAF